MTPYQKCKATGVGKSAYALRAVTHPVVEPTRNGHLSGRAVVANFTSA